MLSLDELVLHMTHVLNSTCLKNVSRPFPFHQRPWEEWTLVAQLCVVQQRGGEGEGEGEGEAGKRERISGDDHQATGMCDGVPGLAEKLPRSAWSDLYRCLGWFRPDVTYSRKPLPEVRLHNAAGVTIIGSYCLLHCGNQRCARADETSNAYQGMQSHSLSRKYPQGELQCSISKAP